MSRQFKVSKCWKGDEISLKHLTEQRSKLLPQLQKNNQNVNKVGGGNCNRGPLSHFQWRHIDILEKNKQKHFFSKKLKVAGYKCCNKFENKLLWEGNITKVVRFLSRQLITATISSCDFFFL